MEGGETPKLGPKLTFLEGIKRAIKEEEERRTGIWTKLYKGLSEADQDNLLKSASSLMQKFTAQNPNDLPNIIILPEISARPLYYLISPAIEAICNTRQSKIPTFIFFQMHKGAELTLIDKEGRERNLTPVKELRKVVGGSSSNPILQDFLKSEIELREGGPAKAIKMRDLMRRRAQEISNYSKVTGITNPYIVIFDDYVTAQHSSIEEIRFAFGSDIPAYCLLQERGVVFPQSMGIFTGMEDPYGITEIKNSQGFAYRSKYEGNRHAIGVDKDENSMYVKNSPARNYDSMQNLRLGLQTIGQLIAKKLSTIPQTTA